MSSPVAPERSLVSPSYTLVSGVVRRHIQGGRVLKRVLPPWLQERLAICGACESWTGRSCRLHPNCTRCYLARPGSLCPAVPPRWLPAASIMTNQNKAPAMASSPPTATQAE